MSTTLEHHTDHAHAATQEDFDVSPVPLAERCKYPSKYCGNPRAQKLDGKLHRFCELHRRRANTNQKRWTSVRRRLAREARDHHKRQDLLDPFWPNGLGYYGPGMHSPTCPETFTAYGNVTPWPTMVLPPKRLEVAAPLDDAEIHILTTLLTPTTFDTCAPQRPVPPVYTKPDYDLLALVDDAVPSHIV